MSQYEIHWQPMIAWALMLVMFVVVPILALVLDPDAEEPTGPNNRWSAEYAVEATAEAYYQERIATEEAEQWRESQKNDE